MNELQKVIFEIIYKIVNVENIFNYGQSTTYGLKNYIARYSLAADQYYISEQALKLFKSLQIPTPLTRSAINKKLFTYEHAIPASYISKLIQQSDLSKDAVANLLQLSDCVAIITKEEDKLLAKNYAATMPDKWEAFNDSPFQRYKEVDIKLSQIKWEVKGSLKR